MPINIPAEKHTNIYMRSSFGWVKILVLAGKNKIVPRRAAQKSENSISKFDLLMTITLFCC